MLHAVAPDTLRAVDLSPGESVIFQGRPSWRSILGFYFLGLLVAAVAGVIGAVAASVGVGVAIGAGVFVLALIAGWLKRVFTRYTITTRRLRVQRGVFTRQIQETRIDRLQDHSIRQTLPERMLGVGTIDFDTSGEEHGDMFRFEGVARPEAIVLDIDRVVRQSESPAIPPAAEPPPD
jgi:uncharacterized membrane protein YdbT with pleckstrin-like domain